MRKEKARHNLLEIVSSGTSKQDSVNWGPTNTTTSFFAIAMELALKVNDIGH